MKNLLIVLAIVMVGMNTVNAQDTWTSKAGYFGGNIFSAAAFSINNKIYVGTGNITEDVPTKEFWEFDPANNTWTQKAEFAGTARYGTVGFAINGKGYIFGGVDNQLWEYNPTLDAWTQKASLPNEDGLFYYDAAGFVIGNKAYIGTGWSLSSGQFKNKKDLWEYNPLTDSWTPKSDFPSSARYAAAAFAIGVYGYMGLGSDDFNIYQDFYKYDPTSDTWSAIANFGGEGRYFSSSFALGSKAFVGLGLTANVNLKKDLWEYNPINNTWAQKADFPGIERLRAIGIATTTHGYMGMGAIPGPTPPACIDTSDFWQFSPMSLGVQENDLNNIISLYPNPFVDKTNLHTNSIMKDATISIYNSNGQLAREIKHISGQDITIYREEFPIGLYLICLKEEDKIISTKKILIED
jgi:N-acetylneuraminic acid mutarotase